MAARIPVAHLTAPRAAVGSVLKWDGARFVPAAGGDSVHPGAGVDSIKIGTEATATELRAVAIGYRSKALGADDSTAVGSFAVASGQESNAFGTDADSTGSLNNAIGSYALASGISGNNAFGSYAQATGANDSLAVGHVAVATAVEAIAIGRDCNNGTAYTAKIMATSLEVAASAVAPGGLATSIILADTAGARWRLTVSTGGALVVAAA